MNVTLSLFAGAGAQFFDNNGNPLTGGKIYTYAAGTTTPKATYTTASDSAFHTNPIVLDSAGRIPNGGEIWLSAGEGYKFVVKTSTDVLIATYDNVPSSAQPPAANDADSIMYEQGYTVTAGSFVVGKTYRIVSVGTTDFTLIGAVSNTSGIHFIATGAGTGTGTADLSQTVETKLRETISVKDFGAVGDGITDDTTALTQALTAATDLLLTGTLKITSPITLTKTNLRIHAEPGSSIVYAGSTGSTWVLRFNDVDSFIVDGQLTIDCDTKAGIGIEVRGVSGAALVDISGVTVIDCTHSSPSVSGAAGIQVVCDSGTGKVASITNCVIRNVTRTTGDGTGAVCSGIAITDFDVMVVENNYIDNVLTGNGTVDADGIKVFSQLVGVFNPYTKASSSVRNNTVKNCEGRFVKTQTRGQCVVEGNYFAIDSSINLITSARGVDAQIAGTIIQNNKVDLLTAWTGGSEFIIFQTQHVSNPDTLGQDIEHRVVNNTVFSDVGVPTYSRVVSVLMTDLAIDATTAICQVDGNVAVGAGGWEGAAVATVGVTVRPPVAAYAAGASANVVISNNRFNTTEFMERFANGANATNAYDFAGQLVLTVINNYLPLQRGDVAVLPHSANNSFTSSFCVAGNSVGTRGNRVAMPFDFAKILGGSSFEVSGESTPARTNAPANYTFGKIERQGAVMWTDNGAYRYQSYADINATPSWIRYGNRVVNTWTSGTYATLRTVPNSATATTQQLGDALNTLVGDLKTAGLVG